MKIRFNKTILIVVLIFVIGICAGGFGVPMFMAKFFPSDDVKEAKAEEAGPLHDLDEFTVNLSGGGIVRADITIEGASGQSSHGEGELAEKEAFIRDKIISVLGSKSINDIASPEGQQVLKEELLHEINTLSDGLVQGVLFKNFVYSY